jgi:hypothetical protein
VRISLIVKRMSVDFLNTKYPVILVIHEEPRYLLELQRLLWVVPHKTSLVHGVLQTNIPPSSRLGSKPPTDTDMGPLAKGPKLWRSRHANLRAVVQLLVCPQQGSEGGSEDSGSQQKRHLTSASSYFSTVRVPTERTPQVGEFKLFHSSSS